MHVPTARRLLSLVIASAALVATGCQVPSSSASAPSPAAGAPADLTVLPIAEEDTGAHYDRDQWNHWTSAGGGCDRREAVLKEQGRDVTTGKGCKATGGAWTSSYDGQTVRNAKDLDIDHMVPLAEVQRSGRIENGRRVGPRQWSDEDRERYANDPAVLVVASAKSNRAKGDKDPAKWLPTNDRCGYARHWIRVKTTYLLSVDQAEHDALAGALRNC